MKTFSSFDKNKNELSKQLEQEQNHRNGDHMEGGLSVGGEWEKRYKELEA